jgi:hypothetical protein
MGHQNRHIVSRVAHVTVLQKSDAVLAYVVFNRFEQALRRSNVASD